MSTFKLEKQESGRDEMMSSPPLCQPAGPHKQKGEMSPPGGGSSEVFQNTKMKDDKNIFFLFLGKHRELFLSIFQKDKNNHFLKQTNKLTI